MAQLQESIVGFELGPFVPPTGVTLGYLLSPNGYLTTDITTGSKRSGTYGFKAAAAAAQSKHARVQLLAANTALPATNSTPWEIRVRYFFRINTLPDADNLVISFLGNGTNAFELQLQMNTSGQLRVVPSLCGNTTTAYQGSFSTNTWYQVKLRIYGMGSSAGGTVSTGLRESQHVLGVYSEDGETEMALFADSTAIGNNMPAVWPNLCDMGQSALSGGPSATREIWYDDFWNHMVTETADVGLLEWPIGTKVECYPPTANGTTNNFTRGGVDTGANWSQVSEIPKTSGAGTQYVSSATAGQVDQYQHANLATSTDVVYHIQAVAFVLDDTTPQQLQIGATLYNAQTRDAVGVARYALAHQIYGNTGTLSKTDFDALQFGIKKTTAGGTTLFSEQEFLEVLTGPPNTIEEDLGGSDWTVTAAFDATGGTPIDVTDLTFATGTLGFRLGGQGVEINVPEPWMIERIDIGYRGEGDA